MRTISKFRLLCTFSMITLSTAAHSEESVVYSAGMTVGLRDIAWDLTGTTAPIVVDGLSVPSGRQKLSIDETLLTVGFIGGLNFNRLTLSASAEFSPGDNGTSISERQEPAEEGNGLTLSANRKSELERQDFNLTASYQVWRGLSMFSGYKHTRFEIKAEEDDMLFLRDKDQTYEQSGFFLGADYTWIFGQRGALSATIGYAFLDVDLSESNVEIKENGLSFGEYRFSGSATGISYGLQWSVPVSDHWSYSASVKYQSFETKNNTVVWPFFNDGRPQGDATQSNVSIEQTDTILNIGVLYAF